MIYHSGPKFQRGRGLGSIFAALFRGMAPIAKLGISAGRKIFSSPLAQKLGKTALDAAKKSAVNIAADIIDPSANSQKTAQKELEEARQKIATTLRGGAKRKRKKNTSASGPRGKKQKKSRKSPSVRARHHHNLKKSANFKRVYSLLD